MDQNKNEEHSSGGPPVNSQHHTEDMALYLQEKSHSSNFIPLGEDERSGPGASSGRTTHGLYGTEINEDSIVINGDVIGKHPDRTKRHMISGGSVKNNSTLYNGDLDLDSLMKTLAKSARMTESKTISSK